MTRRRGPALLASGLLLAGLAAPVVPAGATVPEAVSQEPAAATPTIELVSRPAWARPTDELAFAITTDADAATTAVQVEVFSALDSVEELEESDTEDVGVRLSRTPPTPVADLATGPDGTRLVPLRVAAEPVDGQTTQLVAPGVHPVVISLLGPGGEVLDQLRTPLVRLGEEEEPWEAPDLAVLLDVDASPTLQPDGTRSLSPSDVRRLARVGEVLAAHPSLDLSVAAVPDTVDALATVDDPAAAAVLDQLRGTDLLRSPYLRLPVAELVEEGLDGLVEPLVSRGTALLGDRFGPGLRGDVWAGELAVGDDGGRLLAALGYERLVVPAPTDAGAGDTAADDTAAGDTAAGNTAAGDTAAGEDEPAPLADSGPRRLPDAGPLLGLVADGTLSAELATALPDRPDAAHVVLARYLLRPAQDDPADITDDRDDDDAQDSATVLVRPGPLAEGSALAGLLDLLDDPAAPVQVGGLDLVDDEPDVDDDGEPLPPLEREPPPGPDLAGTAATVLSLAGPLDSFAAMLADRSPLADDLRLQVATAIAADTPPRARAAALAAVRTALDRGFDAVALAGQTNLNLTSREGTLPVTVTNANPYAVDVLLRVRSDRLRFPEGDAFTLTIAEGEQRRIDIPVEARATGSVPVFVELLSPDDRFELQDLRLNVRSTAVSGAGLVISIGAVIVLLTWWVRHSRATRRARRSDPEEGSIG